MESEIDLHDIFRVLWKDRLLIGGIFCIAVVVVGAISFALPSAYRASCLIALGNFGDPIFTTESLTERILLSDELLAEVISELNLDIPPEDFNRFKESIRIKRVADNVLEISIETEDRMNASKIISNMVLLFVNSSEASYNKYKNSLTEKLTVTQKSLTALDDDISITREVLKNIDALSGITQEQLELSHSRTMEYLQNEEARRASLLEQYLNFKGQLDFLENMKVIVVSEEPLRPVKPQKVLIIGLGGMLGLIVGIFAAFLRRGRRPPEFSH
jgi:uncharacterized protein involved in exopolysaccharide biosynthesis